MEFNISQKLGTSIAPQMQQSLNMLQASTLELQSMVQQELQANPVLEEILEKPKDEETREEGALDDEEDPFGDDDYDTPYPSATRYDKDAEERRQFFFDSVTERESLQQHLLAQIPLSELSTQDKVIAELLIGSIDDRGYLATPLQELSYTTCYLEGELERVLSIIQTFHPVGVGARSLSECLTIQLDRLGKAESIESVIVTKYINELSHKKYPEIARQLKVPVTEVQKAADFIATLSPKPGSMFSSEANQYIIADVEIRRMKEGDFMILTNDTQIPNIRISDTYKDMMGSESRSEVRHYIRDKIRAGKFLIKSIQQRQQTIMNIARELLKYQREFFDKGPAHLKPLTMAQVAKDVGVHETTVSRAIANKYIQTPYGIFEMKYFFTTGYTSDSGEVVSNSSVKDALAELIKTEDPKKPLSDMDIVDILNKKGIPIARRTVAKYRQELNILPSNLRRTY